MLNAPPPGHPLQQSFRLSPLSLSSEQVEDFLSILLSWHIKSQQFSLTEAKFKEWDAQSAGSGTTPPLLKLLGHLHQNQAACLLYICGLEGLGSAMLTF